jgi:hypothetical protein
MKRAILWTLWALVPVAALAMHLGPGQKHLARDEAAEIIAKAEALERDGKWTDAAKLYSQARGLLVSSADVPPIETLKVRYAEARAIVWSGDLVAGQEAFQSLVAELTDESSTKVKDASLLARARSELAATSYSIAWLMRLEQASREEWYPESEIARQQYRLLAEEAIEQNSPEAEKLTENLETVIRFQDISEKQLSECDQPGNTKNAGKNIKQKKRDQRASRQQKQQQPKDAREDINKNAGEERHNPKGS